MTRTTNARLAGFTFLLYIAAGITSMVLFRQAAGSEGIAAKLEGLAARPMGRCSINRTATESRHVQYASRHE